jgi:hypothetical protein
MSDTANGMSSVSRRRNNLVLTGEPPYLTSIPFIGKPPQGTHQALATRAIKTSNKRIAPIGGKIGVGKIDAKQCMRQKSKDGHPNRSNNKKSHKT